MPKYPRDERDRLDRPRPYMGGPGEVNSRRRPSPAKRMESRHSVAGEELPETAESILNTTRKKTPEYQDFLNRARKARSGKMTASETGAKQMAQDLSNEITLKGRRYFNRLKREKAAAERGRMT